MADCDVAFENFPKIRCDLLKSQDLLKVGKKFIIFSFSSLGSGLLLEIQALGNTE